MLVIADSSALIALDVCDALPLLSRLFHQVMVPRAMLEEVSVPGKAAAERLMAFLRDRVMEVDVRRFVFETGSLGRGEVEAMALYREMNADRLLMDDRRARRIAQLNGISVLGTLGVLLAAKEAGLIERIGPHIARLRDSDIYFSDNSVKLQG